MQTSRQTTAVKFEDIQDILEKKIDNHVTILHKWSFHLNLSVNGRRRWYGSGCHDEFKTTV